MNRTETLNTAKDIITNVRAAQYGEPHANFETIAGLWTAYLGIPVNRIDVAMMMTLLKVARVKANPSYADSYLDGVGYLAIAAELATEPTP